MRSRFFLQIVLICIGSWAWADQTYFKYDEIQWSQKYPAYLDVIDTLVSLKADLSHDEKSSEFRTFNFRESIYHISKLRKAKTTLVFIHGLYGGADQFDSFFRSMKSNGSDANAILLTLPGHYEKGNFDKPVKEATKEQWIEAVHQTLKVAKAISDKVVVVGQSTGGLLATYSAINFSNLIDGIILLEPALKVHKRIDIATCLGKHLVKEASSLSFIAKLIGMDAPKGISVSMGCEVAKFANQLLDRKLIEPSPYEAVQDLKEEPLEEAMARLAKQVQVPVLMVNNLSDHVVDPKYNKVFASLLKSKMYLEINSDGKTKHGDSKTLETSYKDNAFYQYVCDFLVQNFAERNCARIYYEEKMKPYIFPVHSGMDEKGIENAFAKVKEDHISEPICKIFKINYTNTKLCAQFKEMIQDHIQFWQKVGEGYKVRSSGEDFQSFFERWRNQFTNEEKAAAEKFSDSARYFKTLLEGVKYRDIGGVYLTMHEEFQRRLEFLKELEKEKDNIEKSEVILKKISIDESKIHNLAVALTGKISVVEYSDRYTALRVIMKSQQIKEEIVAQKNYLRELRNYLQRVYNALDQRVVDPAELEYIMKNYQNLPDDSYFAHGFDIQKTKAVISYLLQTNSDQVK